MDRQPRRAAGDGHHRPTTGQRGQRARWLTPLLVLAGSSLACALEGALPGDLTDMGPVTRIDIELARIDADMQAFTYRDFNSRFAYKLLSLASDASGRQ